MTMNFLLLLFYFSLFFFFVPFSCQFWKSRNIRMTRKTHINHIVYIECLKLNEIGILKCMNIGGDVLLMLLLLFLKITNWRNEFIEVPWICTSCNIQQFNFNFWCSETMNTSLLKLSTLIWLGPIDTPFDFSNNLLRQFFIRNFFPLYSGFPVLKSGYKERKKKNWTRTEDRKINRWIEENWRVEKNETSEMKTTTSIRMKAVTDEKRKKHWRLYTCSA